MSLSNKGQVLIPDYKLTVEDSYRLFAVSEVVDKRSLKVLSLAPHRLAYSRLGKRRLDIPSWVPDLRLIGESDPLISYTIREQRFFAGGAKDLPVAKILDGGKVLQCQGRIFDTVTGLAPTIMDMLLNDNQAPSDFDNSYRSRMGRWLQKRHDLAMATTETLLDNPETMRSFSRTMLCDMSGMRDGISGELIGNFQGYLRYQLNASKSPNEATPSITEEEQRYILRIEQAIMAWAMVRKFCVTGKYRFGQVPFEAETGDRICVLVGAEVPFLIRPGENGYYKLVGECYIDGVMYGEALSEPRVVLEDIQLE